MEQLIRYLESRAGEGLRGVAQYSESGTDLAYMRGELDEEEAAKRVEEFHENIVGQAVETPLLDELGERYATVELRSEAVIIDVAGTAERGVLISLDADVAPRLTTFIQNCVTRVRAPDFRWM